MNILNSIQYKLPTLNFNNAYIIKNNEKYQIINSYQLSNNSNLTINVFEKLKYSFNKNFCNFISKNNFQITFLSNQYSSNQYVNLFNNQILKFNIDQKEDLIIHTNIFFDLSHNFLINNFNHIILFNDFEKEFIYYSKNININQYDLTFSSKYEFKYIIYNKYDFIKNDTMIHNLYKFILENKNKNKISYESILLNSEFIDFQIDNYNFDKYDNFYYNDFEFEFIINEINNNKHLSLYSNILGGSVELLNFIYFIEWLEIWQNEFIKFNGKFYKNFQNINNKDDILYYLNVYRLKKIMANIDKRFLIDYKLNKYIDDVFL